MNPAIHRFLLNIAWLNVAVLASVSSGELTVKVAAVFDRSTCYHVADNTTRRITTDVHRLLAPIVAPSNVSYDGCRRMVDNCPSSTHAVNKTTYYFAFDLPRDQCNKTDVIAQILHDSTSYAGVVCRYVECVTLQPGQPCTGLPVNCTAAMNVTDQATSRPETDSDRTSSSGVAIGAGIGGGLGALAAGSGLLWYAARKFSRKNSVDDSESSSMPAGGSPVLNLPPAKTSVPPAGTAHG